MNSVFLISEKTLKSNGVINDNVDNMYICPAIQFAQDSGLQPLIGTKLYQKLMQLVNDDSITGATDYKFLLDEYITPYLLNKVTADIQLPLAYKMRNQGVVQNTTEHSFNSSIRDVQYLIQHYENQANFYANRMSDYLKANRSKYPEYCSVDSCADMPSDSGAYKTGIYLG
jgi:hypothetical protein